MLSVTQIRRTEKLCGNTWDFQVFQDSEFLGATLEYLVDGIARHNFFEFSRDETGRPSDVRESGQSEG